jgi:uncharacterized membrane protein YgdD (TMEM256/DUF423 family)
VAAGAFGAHALRPRLTPEHLNQFELAARYQMYHAFALFVAAWACDRFPGRSTTASGYAFLVGILIFCGSVYALAFGAPTWFGAITPVGGLCFLAGWILLGAPAVSHRAH